MNDIINTAELLIKQLVEYKQNNMERFIKNREIAQRIVHSRMGDSANNLKKVLDTM